MVVLSKRWSIVDIFASLRKDISHYNLSFLEINILPGMFMGLESACRTNKHLSIFFENQDNTDT